MHRYLLLATLLITTISSPLIAQPRWQWIVPATGPAFDEGLDLGVGPDGDVHIVGQFSDSLHVDSNRINAFNGYDGFSVRLSKDGKVRSFNAYGGLYEDELKTIAIDNKGNYYLAGAFEDQAVIGGTQIESIEPFTIDIFLAKFDKTGVVQWVNVYGAPDYDEAAPFVAVDSVGNVYLAGGFGKTAQFGTKSITSKGGSDIFVAKISALGDVTWVKGAGSLKDDFATDVGASPNGDRVYIVGNFSGSVAFGGTSPLESYSGGQDMVAWALSADGGYQWAKRIGYQGKDNGIRCFVDDAGRLLTTGGMMQTTTFDDKSLKANGEFEPDIFVCRFTKTGSIDLLNRYGGTFKDVGMGIVSDPHGAILVTGQFDTTTTLGSTILASHGGLDMFLMRLWPNGDVEWARGAGGKFDDVGNAVAISSDGVPYVCGTFDTEAWFDNWHVVGERFTDAFVAALECGPNTELNPKDSTITMCAGMDSSISAPNGYEQYTWYVDGAIQKTPTKSKLNLSSLTEGTHPVFVQIVDSYGCVGTSDTVLIITTPGLPNPEIKRTGNVLGCTVPDVMYQWYLEGQPILGATSQTVEIQGDGLYKVLISDGKGCSRFSANLIVGSTDVAELEETQLVVWPNPFTDGIEVQGVAGAEIVIRDMLGNELLRTVSITGRERLVLQAAVGTYVLTARTANGTESRIITRH